MADVGAHEKPSVLIIGGLGYIGRFLALHIHKNNLASEVRLVDKVLPQLAWLAPEFAEACSQDKFIQADASRERKLPLFLECFICDSLVLRMAVMVKG
jgi:nucleoside-diphosphate-sugar epimerase